ncbi:hypothetical protein AAVH_11322 [Aphelenchoides avenae]|nr:hypothetical protein AAVH_11322 [Aphelenchus avenae]
MRCTICNLEVDGRAKHWAHLKTASHKQKLQEILKDHTTAFDDIVCERGRPHCRTCECDIPRGEEHAVMHLLGKKHLRSCVEQGREVSRLLELRPELHSAWSTE